MAHLSQSSRWNSDPQTRPGPQAGAASEGVICVACSMATSVWLGLNESPGLRPAVLTLGSRTTLSQRCSVNKRPIPCSPAVPVKGLILSQWSVTCHLVWDPLWHFPSPEIVLFASEVPPPHSGSYFLADHVITQRGRGARCWNFWGSQMRSLELPSWGVELHSLVPKPFTPALCGTDASRHTILFWRADFFLCLLLRFPTAS